MKSFIASINLYQLLFTLSLILYQGFWYPLYAQDNSESFWSIGASYSFGKGYDYDRGIQSIRARSNIWQIEIPVLYRFGKIPLSLQTGFETGIRPEFNPIVKINYYAIPLLVYYHVKSIDLRIGIGTQVAMISLDVVPQYEPDFDKSVYTNLEFSLPIKIVKDFSLGRYSSFFIQAKHDRGISYMQQSCTQRGTTLICFDRISRSFTLGLGFRYRFKGSVE